MMNQVSKPTAIPQTPNPTLPFNRQDRLLHISENTPQPSPPQYLNHAATATTIQTRALDPTLSVTFCSPPTNNIIPDEDYRFLQMPPGVAMPADLNIAKNATMMDNVAWHHAYFKLRRASAIIGASTVAIDHKIEQAMDLVKSHLMFAVHEEVMVLKEQIKELLEKNSQLEIENNILRSSATPETLAKLSQATPAASSQSSSS